LWFSQQHVLKKKIKSEENGPEFNGLSQ